jgi:hypothetical protein
MTLDKSTAIDSLYPPETPLMFTDGTAVYRTLAKTYKTHKVGYYIQASSGAGKTHFVDAQKEKHWIDGDLLWMVTHAHPDGAWWLESTEKIQEIARRGDIIVEQAKKLGFWIVGTDKYTLVPDAIVIPPWEHKKQILMREQGSYDGGATSADHQQVLDHRKWIEESNPGVSKFETVAEAAEYLARKAL